MYQVHSFFYRRGGFFSIAYFTEGLVFFRIFWSVFQDQVSNSRTAAVASFLQGFCSMVFLQEIAPRLRSR